MHSLSLQTCINNCSFIHILFLKKKKLLISLSDFTSCMCLFPFFFLFLKQCLAIGLKNVKTNKRFEQVKPPTSSIAHWGVMCACFIHFIIPAPHRSHCIMVWCTMKFISHLVPGVYHVPVIIFIP